LRKFIFSILKQFVEHSPKFALIYRSLRDILHNIGEPIETSLGFKFMGNPLMQNGKFEQDETDLFKKIIPQVNVIVMLKLESYF
jgi:hypothetical protein